MKCMERNKREFYFAPFDRKESILNEYGKPTGRYRLVYSKVKSTKGNISSNFGTAEVTPFGKEVDYDRTIAMDEVPFDEYAGLWLESRPMVDSTGCPAKNEAGDMITPPDHLVKKVAVGLDSVIVAVKQVNVRG